MYYHVLIKIGERKIYYELDKVNLDEIIEDVVVPFLEKEEILFSGKAFNSEVIMDIEIKETEKTASELVEIERVNSEKMGIISIVSPESIIGMDKYTKNITKDVMKCLASGLDIGQKCTGFGHFVVLNL